MSSFAMYSSASAISDRSAWVQDPQTGTLIEDMLMLNTHTWKWFKAEVGLLKFHLITRRLCSLTAL